MVWRTCPNSQHEIHSLAEVIKDVSGCAIEGRFISIPPHEGVDLAEGEWRLCTTRCSPPRTSVVCRASSSTPTSNRTIHHVRERPLYVGWGVWSVVFEACDWAALFCPLSGFRHCQQNEFRTKSVGDFLLAGLSSIESRGRLGGRARARGASGGKAAAADQEAGHGSLHAP